MFVNMYQSDTKKTVESFFNAQYPFRQNRFETIYEKCYDSFFVRKNLYKCNVCQIKLLGDAELLKHNKCLEHQTELEKQIMVILDNPAVDTYVSKIVNCVKCLLKFYLAPIADIKTLNYRILSKK